jgi:thioesterase domain-containing protein/NAD(P)-dependent dehydrogenase (short-subunit alcohol dehydrogenase family)
VDASESAASRLKSLDQNDSQGFYSLMYLAQAIGGLDHTMVARICVVTRGIFDVDGSGVPAPERATVAGICKVIPQEYSSLSCITLDLGAEVRDDEGEQIAIESLTEFDESSRLVAWRATERWALNYVKRQIHENSAPTSALKERGVYLITRGFGGMGLTLAEHLAREFKARLVLIGRAGVGETPERIAKVQAIEAAGGEVLALSADVASLPEMQAAMHKAVRRFGRIDGVIHSAGLPAGGVIQRKTRLDASRIFDPKVRGTLVLEAALEGQTPGFMLLCSSLTAVIGGFGQADYCAANGFLDAWASARPHRQSVNWDGWAEVGMAARLTGEAQDNFIVPNEGVEVFRRVFGSGWKQTAISTVDLAPRLRVKDATSLASTNVSVGAAHARPNLSSVYIAPRTALETSLVECWEKFLGVHPIGVEDDFFSLGGDSLLAVQLLFHIRRETAADLPTHILAEAPTVAQLARKFPEKDSPQANKLPEALVCLKQGHSEVRPLFLFHPVGGQVYIYRDLATCLSEDQPVWGVRADDQADATNMVSLASHYLKAVAAVQPHGPYRLGGSSFGGTLAFEIAQQLSAQNEAVDLLVMIDAPAPVHCPQADSNDVELLAYLLGLAQPDAATFTQLRSLSTDAKIQHLSKSENKRLSLSAQEAKGFLKLWRSNLQALRTYRPTPAAFPTLFFQATQPDGMNRTDYREGWHDLIPKMEVFDLHDTHIGINLMPHAKTSAEIITSRLAKGK